MNYTEVQNIAKQTMSYIKSIIQPGMSLLHIRKLCEEKMLELGADSFWYWNIGAFCFAGHDTILSISGKNYQTPEYFIKANDIITIDLSPQHNNIWGDYARTIIIEDGKVVMSTSNIIHREWRNGLLMEEDLHEELHNFVTPRTTFEELYFHMNELINEHGFTNLDFLGNLGHSIVKNKDDRIYIERGNTTLLSDVSFFTFEPHICAKGSNYGYKMENIYYFNNETLTEL